MGFVELHLVPRVCCNCYSRLGLNTPLADSQKDFEESVKNGKTIEQTLDDLGYRRMCCRNSLIAMNYYYLRDTPPVYNVEGKGAIQKMEVPVPRANTRLEFPN
jgi:DNA-directed RNA polymerase subunit N (RpoN/RPB10)